MANEKFVGANTVFTIENRGLWRTLEFGDTDPAWASIAHDGQTKFLNQIFRDFEIDPFCPAMQGTGDDVGIYLLTSAGLYYCPNAAAITVTENDWQPKASLANYHLIRANRSLDGEIVLYGKVSGSEVETYYLGDELQEQVEFNESTSTGWLYDGVLVPAGPDGNLYGIVFHVIATGNNYACPMGPWMIGETGYTLWGDWSGEPGNGATWIRATQDALPYIPHEGMEVMSGYFPPIPGAAWATFKTWADANFDTVTVTLRPIYYGVQGTTGHSLVLGFRSVKTIPIEYGPYDFGGSGLESGGLDISHWGKDLIIHAAGQDGNVYESVGFDGQFNLLSAGSNPVNGVRIWDRRLGSEQATIKNDDRSQLHGLVSYASGTPTVKRTRNDYGATLDFSPQIGGNSYIAGGPYAYDVLGHNPHEAIFAGYQVNAPSQYKLITAKIKDDGTVTYADLGVSHQLKMVTFADHRSQDFYASGPAGVGFYDTTANPPAFYLKNGNLPTRDYLKVLAVTDVPVDCDAPDNHKRLECQFGSSACDAATSMPVELRSGTKMLRETDLTVQTPAGALSFTRSYLQDEQHTFDFMGLGWTHNHTYKLTVSGTIAEVRLGNGGLLKLTQTSPGHFVSNTGSAAALDLTSAQEYTLKAHDESTYVFTVSSGLLLCRRWPNNEEWNYTYSGSNLIRIEDGYGRQLKFSYRNGADFKNGKLWRVGDHTSDYLDTASPVGRYVEFDYLPNKVKPNGVVVNGSTGLLSSVRDVRGQIWGYDYYGQDGGETTETLLNYLTEVRSPSVDITGDGTPDSNLTLQRLTYDHGTQMTVNGDMELDSDWTAIAGAAPSINQRSSTQKHSGNYSRHVVVTQDGQGIEGNTWSMIAGHTYKVSLWIYTNDGVVIRVTGTTAWRGLLGSSQSPHWIPINFTITPTTNSSGHRLQLIANSPDAEFYVDEVSILEQTDMIQELGIAGTAPALLTKEFLFQPDGAHYTTERVDSKVTTYHFGSGNGAYLGPENPLGEQSRRVLNRHARPVLQVDPQGNETVLEWSGDGKNLQRVTDALSNTTQFSYDSSDRLTSSTDPEGRQTEYTYGDATNPRMPTIIKVRDTDGGIFLQHQTFSYDSKGRVLTERQINPADGTTILRQVTRSYYAFDDANIGARGMLQTLTQEDMGGSNDVSTTYFYDSYGRVVQTNQNSNFGSCTRSYTVYDAAGNVVASICNYENAGAAPTTAAEAATLYNPAYPDRNRVTTHTYDQLGRRIQTTVNAGSGETLTTLTVYDALNRVVRTVSNFVAATAPANPYTAAHSAFNNHGTDNIQNLVTDTAYNARGLVEGQTDVLGNVSRYVYDDAGRQIKAIQNYVSNGVDPAFWVWNNNRWENGSGAAISHGANQDQNIISASEYDANGNLVQTRDVLGKMNRMVYDALNRVVKTVRNWQSSDPATWVWDSVQSRWEDAAGQPIPFGTSNDQNLVAQTKYDHMGRVVRTQDETGEWTLFGYDPLGRQVRVIRNAGNPAYDLVADPDLSSYSPSSNADQDILTTTFYDAQGRVDYTEDANSTKTKFVYDGLGRQVKVIQNYIAQGISDPAAWVWDSADQRWERGASDNTAIVHGSNQDQNIIALTNYDTDGRVRWTQDVLGRKTWHVYDTVGREIKTIVNCTYNGTGTTPEDPAYTGSPDSDKDIITRTVYDAFGRVSANIDARGNETRYFYNKLGRRTRTIANYIAQGATDPAAWLWNSSVNPPRWQNGSGGDIGYGVNNDENLITEPTYDLAGRVISSRDQSGKVIQQVYDKANRRIRTVANYVTQVTPDPSLWLWDTADQQWEDVSGNVINHGTDFDLNLISETNYNAAGQVIATRDVRGTRTGFIYDGLGRRQQVVQAEGSPLASKAYTAYDKGGRVSRSVRNWQSAATTHNVDPLTWAWNATLQRWEDNDTPVKSVQHGVLNDQNLPMAYTVDKLGRVVGMTNPVGSATSTAYYKDGRVKSTTDPLDYVTEHRYDGLRRLRRVVQAYLSNGVDPANWIWDAGQSRWEDGSNNAINHTSTNDRNIITDVTLDVVGRQTAIRDPRGNQTTYAYDWLNRRTGLTQPPNPTSQTWLTTYADLPSGQSRITATNPLNHQTEQNFDRLGRVIGINYLNESPKNTPDVAFAYDIAGNRTLMREFAGSTTIRRTEYTYDAAHRLSQVGFDNDGNGTTDQIVTYDYDRGGLRTQMTLPGNLTITYTYDPKGQLVSLTDWAAQCTEYSYDQAGRLVAMERPNNLKSIYSYDLASRLERLQHNRATKLLGHFAYEMDARGNRTKAVEVLPRCDNDGSPSGPTIDSGSVAVDYYRGTWTSVAGGFMQTAEPGAAFRLLFVGKQAQLVLGTNMDHGICDVYVDGTFWRSIDSYSTSDGQDTSIILDLAEEGPHVLEVRNSSSRHREAQGWKLRFKELNIPIGIPYDAYSIEYGYDALARLKVTTYYYGLHTAPASIHHQGIFTYDVAGNRTREQSVIPSGPPKDFTYDAANRLATLGSAPILYDAAGRLLSELFDTYTWDRAGRLRSADNVTYTYNGLGHRLSRTESGTTTTYLLDMALGLPEVLTSTIGTSTTRYLHDPSGLNSQQQPTTAWVFPTVDGLGNVRGIHSVSTPTYLAHYAPYGATWSTDGTNATMYGFTGEPVDGNLVYLRARYYNTFLGTFLSLDPLEGSPMQPMSLNRYAYVRGNPINLGDPSGLISENPYIYSTCQFDSQDACAKGAVAVVDIGVNPLAISAFGSDAIRSDFRDVVKYRKGYTIASSLAQISNKDHWHSLSVDDVSAMYFSGSLDKLFYIGEGGGQIQTNSTGTIKFRRCANNSKFTIPSNSIAHIDKYGESIFTISPGSLTTLADMAELFSEWYGLSFDTLRTAMNNLAMFASPQKTRSEPNKPASTPIGIERVDIYLGALSISIGDEIIIGNDRISMGENSITVSKSYSPEELPNWGFFASTGSIGHVGQQSPVALSLSGFVAFGPGINAELEYGSKGLYINVEGGFGYGMSSSSGVRFYKKKTDPITYILAHSMGNLTEIPVGASFDDVTIGLMGGSTVRQNFRDGLTCALSFGLTGCKK